MDTLTEAPVRELGTVRFATNVGPEQLLEGDGHVMRMEMESGAPPLVWAAITDRRQAAAMQALFSILRERPDQCAEQMRARIEDDVAGEIDWTELAERFDYVTKAF